MLVWSRPNSSGRPRTTRRPQVLEAPESSRRPTPVGRRLRTGRPAKPKQSASQPSTATPPRTAGRSSPPPPMFFLRTRRARGGFVSEEVVLAPETVEALARRCGGARVRRRPSVVALVSAAELASLLGVDRSWVYEHAAELGAVRLGDGPRSRLRFDPVRAKEAVSCFGGRRSGSVEERTVGRKRRGRPAGRIGHECRTSAYSRLEGAAVGAILWLCDRCAVEVLCRGRPGRVAH